jgi:hypothetical protein
MDEEDEPANNKPGDGASGQAKNIAGDEAKVEQKTAEQKGLSRLQGYTLHILEDAFERYGIFVASHPFLIIASCLALTLLCGSGLYWFRAENEGSHGSSISYFKKVAKRKPTEGTSPFIAYPLSDHPVIYKCTCKLGEKVLTGIDLSLFCLLPKKYLKDAFSRKKVCSIGPHGNALDLHIPVYLP